ncbi:MAG: uroporphyrinogen-III synthase [Alphaproteobacteria bacterium]|nr:uroporphyrinogen-III synthase [Alphaproteobacteria bacterium]
MTIWLTRPRDQSEAFAKQLGRPCIIAPVTHIVYRKPKLEGAYDAVITTSPHGAIGISDYHDLPLYTVGEASAEAARSQGFKLALPIAQDAATLAAMVVVGHNSPSKFLYLSGDETRIDIKKLIESQGHSVTQVVTYEAIAETQLPQDVTTHWKDISGVLFMSVGAVKAAQALITQDVSHIHAFCISATVAAAAGSLPWKAIHVSASPTQQSLIDCINTTIKA